MTDAFLSYLFGGLWVGLPPAALVLTLWYGMRSSPRIAEPVWRGYSAIGAATLAGVSVILWVFSFVWAQKVGGFGYYDPVLMRFYRCGSITGLAGLVAGFGGAGKLKWPACGLSTLMTLLWLIAATGE
jgi:hypothetical protein